MLSYRKYYFKQAFRQIEVALIMLWYGVILNRGHHSEWYTKKSWFYRK